MLRFLAALSIAGLAVLVVLPSGAVLALVSIPLLSLAAANLLAHTGGFEPATYGAAAAIGRWIALGVLVAAIAQIPPVAEDNDAMRGSYAMIDPLGRFYSNDTGRHLYGSPILEVGVAAAIAEVGWDAGKFIARGGRYDWS